MKVITSEKVPIKMWLDDIEEGALQQAKNLANLPFIFKHLAIMPDSHEGYGMPIGGVLAASGVIIPNAVGVDIGCGMCAVRTSLHSIEKSELEKLVEKIKRRIPVGFDHHSKPQDEEYIPQGYNIAEMKVVSEQYKAARNQVGTLGGGNHFIEIQQGNDGFIWIMVHSGSRNLGKQVADHYNKVAVKLNEMWRSEVEKSKQLAFLPMDIKEAQQYMKEMLYCVDFAFCNRKLMMERIIEVFNGLTDFDVNPFQGKEMINIAHNYARLENHFKQDVIVHRKGATSAKADELGIIPGSQGTKSYITKGLGNPESFMSCSHGAGRKMGRKQAQRELNLRNEIQKMNYKGIIHNITSVKDLDEAAGAYKDIDLVMENQKDLVEVLVELHPLAVIKG